MAMLGESGHSAKNTHLKFESSGTVILDQIVIYNNLIWWTCDIPTQ